MERRDEGSVLRSAVLVSNEQAVCGVDECIVLWVLKKSAPFWAF
jgi:hypothetical protein